jgi:short-subunit dehydrogenase
VTDKAAMAEVIARMDDASSIDLVIANAGISTSFLPPPERERQGGGHIIESITTIRNDDSKFTPTQPSPLQGEGLKAAEQVFAVNFAGVIHTIHPLIERMKARRGGHIAIMSSLAGICALPSAPAYSASKAAVRVYGDALRGMLKTHNVHVSVICPGWISTPLTDKNTFPMPLIMSVERAIHIIMRNLEKKKARIAFPFSLYAALHILAFLPVCVRDFMLQRISAKAHKS